MPAFTFQQRVTLAIVPRLASVIIRCLGVTLRYEDVVDTGAATGYENPTAAIYVLWHRSLLSSAWRFRNRNIAILISESFDGELIARTVQRLGLGIGQDQRPATTQAAGDGHPDAARARDHDRHQVTGRDLSP